VEPQGALRRELSVWEAIGLSLALMAPSMAANINPQATAGTVGRAVPLAFLLATLGVLLIAYTFVRLCQRFHHAGSVYGFVGATLGARAGVVAGWSLLGTYVFYGVVTSTAAGIFGAAALDSLGIWTDQPPWAGFVVAAVALLLVLVLAIVRVRGGTRVLLTIEGLTVALILVVAVVVLVRLATGTAPGGRGVDLSVFTPAPGTDGSALFLGIVFGFLSFAGFEAAATLGEETRDPRRTIPRAILGVAIFGGVYFVFVTAVEVMGFGADDAGGRGVHQVAVADGRPRHELRGGLGGRRDHDRGRGQRVRLRAGVRGGRGPAAVRARPRRRAPRFVRGGRTGRAAPRCPADGGVVLAMYLVIAVAWFGLGGDPSTLFVASGTIGTLILLVVYALATVGAAKLLFFSGTREVRVAEVVIPVLALGLIGYTLFRNVYPYPEGGGGAVPGGLGGVDRRGRAGGAAAAGCRPARGRRADRERGPHR
jgi:hypothetical protein